MLISSLDKCSYSARHDVKVHCNFVDLIETMKMYFSAHNIKSDLNQFTNVFPSINTSPRQSAL